MLRLMIVDDSNIIRSKIARLDRESIFSVVASVGDGLEAIKAQEQYQPDVVTMDLTMPNMDGITCIKKLLELNKELRILVVSALSDRETAIDALDLGARGFLCKPFSDEDLMSALEAVISN